VIYIIHSREPITEAMASQLLSDMTQLAADIDDSSHLQFECIFANHNLVAYELPDTPFTAKLRGTALMQLGPNGKMDDLVAYRVWKDRGAEFAKLHIGLLQDGFDTSNMSIIEVDNTWYFFVHSPWLRYTKERVQQSLALYLEKPN